MTMLPSSESFFLKIWSGRSLSSRIASTSAGPSKADVCSEACRAYLRYAQQRRDVQVCCAPAKGLPDVLWSACPSTRLSLSRVWPTITQWP